MIQRVQSIYLALAIICYAIAPLQYITELSTETQSLLIGFVNSGYYENGNFVIGFSHIWFLLGAVLLAIYGVLVFIRYKNLKRQLKLARTYFLLTLLYAVLIIVAIKYNDGALFADVSWKSADVKIGLKLGYFLIIPPVALSLLALIGIKRDRNTIKSLDRLR